MMLTLEAEIAHTHGLRLNDPTARELVVRWHAAATALRDYLGETQGLDLVDVSTLAEMFERAMRELSRPLSTAT